MAAGPLRYERRFALWGALVTLVEGVVVAAPLGVFFRYHRLTEPQSWLLVRAAPVVLGAAWLIWWLAMRWWRGPLDRAIALRRAGQRADAATLSLATQVTLRLPRRTAILRAALGVIAALALTSLLALRAGFPAREIVTVAVITALHGLVVQVFRVIAWAHVLDRVRDALSPDADPLPLFHQLYRPRLLRAAFATGALCVTAIALFILFFLRPNLESYIKLETVCPLTIAPLTLFWMWRTRRMCDPLEAYLVAACAGDAAPSRDDRRALVAYGAAQMLPYQLGAWKLLIAVVGEALLALQATLLFDVEREYTIPVFVEAFIVTVGAALYEVLWHRVTLRPLLAHLATRHRPSPDDVRTPFGMRTRMLLFLGVLTLFACTLSLLSSFVQYMSLATTFLERESEIRRDGIVSQLRDDPRVVRTPDGIAQALRQAPTRDEAFIYYLPPAEGAAPIVFGGDGRVAPELPARDRALMVRRDAGEMQLPALRLTGSYARLFDENNGRRDDLGAIAVLYPGYWGRGVAFDPQIRVLLFFFALLLIASMGIVVLVASDLTKPIRRLEERAEAMAKGDLNRPVVHFAGELDEVGRLTFAFEAMRRALNEKLRSSTEINLSLEAEVTRRTAELERRNKELADALDALRRAQAELVRAEKMASMGRLVAGIAHEINNPVNAVVNTVGPLESTLEEVIGHGEKGPAVVEAVADAREMIRVIRSGARRTKEIVQALHNYSRGDDESQVEVDLHRGLDESLDLLRHHLKRGIQVERRYGQVGRVRGNAGQLQQVFMNLLTNAAQAIGDRPRGGTIRISTAREGGKVVIVVGDDGPGIPEDVLPRIFDPFFTTKDVGEGSGLGLSIVHGIVERHGGTIAVASQLGEGTTFTVSLPAEPESGRLAAGAADR